MIVVAVLLVIAIAVLPVYGVSIGQIPRRGGHTIFILLVSLVYGLQGIGAYLYTRKQEETLENIIK